MKPPPPGSGLVKGRHAQATETPTAVDLSKPPVTREGDVFMVNGVVKWFNPTKGYGFIAPEAGGKDIFVHISAVQKAGMRSLNEGQRLGFEVEQQQNGRTAAVNLARME